MSIINLIYRLYCKRRRYISVFIVSCSDSGQKFFIVHIRSIQSTSIIRYYYFRAFCIGIHSDINNTSGKSNACHKQKCDPFFRHNQSPLLIFYWFASHRIYRSTYHNTYHNTPAYSCQPYLRLHRESGSYIFRAVPLRPAQNGS